MTISPTLYARQIILPAIQTDAEVTALIPAASLYPSKTPNNPPKPFGRYGGGDTSTPLRPSGWKGGDVDGSYHIWVGVTSAIPDPKTYCEEATAAIADVIDALSDCFVERTQILSDPDEVDVWHGVVIFTFNALAPV
ncbi:uncharacterized protein DUF3168 [Novosphingobium sp. PhB165]|uniref:DUF3168 domain-containing protein n=1 Tax=Novosphingobium sp. PhB165 TaxID=2485105 RepID=UPI00104CF06D|nr:DUF3168 domain-containing protein [Novosphingobium sp. PhB165]TCM21477.1 uncharacterized protein DUF3168 [Novosphingobium sp. PhB165]